MKSAVGADHAGLPLKETVIARIDALTHTSVDLGAHEFDADDDYPDFALAVATEVAEGRADRGVVLCGSGVGQASSRTRYEVCEPASVTTRTQPDKAWNMTT